jgi:hypothetical protein
MSAIANHERLTAVVRRACEDVTASDIHTHLFPPAHGKLLLWGVDELLTYHYLVSELFMVAPRGLRARDFYALPKPAQADLVWEHLFVRRSPVSEATRGVLRTLELLGLDVRGRGLAKVRSWFARRKIETHLPQIMKLAKLDYAVMTNDIFSPEESSCFLRGLAVPEYFKTALRIDPLINDFPAASKQMAAQGYRFAGAGESRRHAQARKFLADWAARLKPIYMAASMSDDFAYPSGDSRSRVLDKVVIPAARELGLPLALMIGVRRQVNPALGLAGDAGAAADVQSAARLAAAWPDVKFLFTFISRVNQHELCILARKFGNVHVFGCWWFCNQASIIQEMTRMRVEMLGTAFTAQHSDSRVLDQLLYKWSEARRILADVLVEKYSALFDTGWRPTEAEIRRDVRRLLGGAFEEFLAK